MPVPWLSSGPPVVSVLLLVLASTACTGSGRDLPDPDDFAAGTCRDAAPALLAVDEQVRQAAEQDADRRAARESLREDQARLRALTADAEDVAGAVEGVVVSVGFARAALDAGALDAEEVDDVARAVDRVVAVCVPTEGQDEP